MSTQQGAGNGFAGLKQWASSYNQGAAQAPQNDANPTPEEIAWHKQVRDWLFGNGGGGGGGGWGGSRRGYGGGGGGGVDYSKIKKQLGDLRTAGRGGIEGVSNEAVMRLAALQQQARDRNAALLAQSANPYRDALTSTGNAFKLLNADARMWGAGSSSLGAEMEARKAAMRNAQADQRSLMGQIGSQLEASLTGRQAAAEQAKQNALNDLERLYTAAMAKLGG